MSVEVKNLSKKYGDQWAVHDLSFKAKRGEILGFLGPNGAGKSTTMKILSCFIQATEGEAFVCGNSVSEKPKEVRSCLGYLPEHNPLYLDMYVKEFLSFAGNIYKIPNKSERIEEVIEMTGLTLEKNKQLGQLSKGYRQRVGLAHSLLHDPEVLILDEPTSGLDPNQLVEIRSLIKRISKDKTVIFSSHIMQEVQAICDRVIIIDRGKLVADSSIDRLADLVQNETEISIQIQATSSKFLEKIPDLLRIEAKSNSGYALIFPENIDRRAEVFAACVENKAILLEMTRNSASVEDVFHRLTDKKNA